MDGIVHDVSDSSLDDIDRLQLREFSADHFRPAADVLPLNRYQVMIKIQRELLKFHCKDEGDSQKNDGDANQVLPPMPAVRAQSKTRSESADKYL